MKTGVFVFIPTNLRGGNTILRAICYTVITIAQTVRDHPVVKQNYGSSAAALFLFEVGRCAVCFALQAGKANPIVFPAFGLCAKFIVQRRIPMSPLSKPVRRLVRGALIAAIYAVLCIVLQPISFSEIQFRVSEALTVLPILMPEAIPGLFIGCLVSNLIGGAGIMDIIFGSLATLIASLLTYLLRKQPAWIALLPVVVVNGLIVGWVLNAAYGAPLLLSMCTVALGQAVVCYVLGLPLLHLFRKRIPEKYYK